ncbi:right-handed parallel beta-helix repeat-containing protein [Haloprofundus sp. MHR1]|uniref:right-handed parallel beta-helix repeat-containing protein n=1 Tax=Haloprofundus sp. MHR1 TaxID=2572921 RepID=UPI0010BEF903|nr:right-handed parallel beta-helix repeat-containing protein [Haloprofundus sp. MHR1]QCJ47410.1 right-handed parallel beta-helix repeat-containing protein [Haloprofundus sp. MHR1]
MAEDDRPTGRSSDAASLPRRDLLTAVVGVAGVSGLAGCLGLFDSDGSRGDGRTPDGGEVGGTPPSIVVWEDREGIVRAETENGPIESGRRPAAVIQAALDVSAQQAGIQNVEVVGNYTVSRPVHLQERTVLNLRNARLTAGGNHAVISVNSISQAAVVGGLLDGDNQSDGEQYLGVLALNNADQVVVDGTEVQNGGYYGVNLYECNDCVLNGIRAHDNFRHGIHPGADTEGRGYFNWLTHCITDNNGVDGVNDRGTTVPGESLDNAFYNCLSRNNGRSGFILDGGVGADEVAARFDVVGCRAYRNGSHGIQLTNCRVSAVNVVTRSNGQSGLLLNGGVQASILNPRSDDHSGPNAGGITIRSSDSAAPRHVVVYGGASTNNSHNVRIASGSNTGPITLRDIDLRGAERRPLWLGEDAPPELTVSNASGYRTTNRGDQTESGDGSASTFRWEHGLAEQPRSVSVTPATPAAAGPFSVTHDGDAIEVTYRTAPEQGDDNLRWWWSANAY